MTELGESVVEEVRTIRETIDKEVNHDLRKLAEGARRTSEAIRKEYGMKVADLSSFAPVSAHEHG